MNDVAEMLRNATLVTKLKVDAATQELSNKKDKSQTLQQSGIFILKNILDKRNGRAELQDLVKDAEEVVHIYNNSLSFEQYCGAKVEDFVLMHNNVFEVNFSCGCANVTLKDDRRHGIVTKSFADVVGKITSKENSTTDTKTSNNDDSSNNEAVVSDEEWITISHGKKTSSVSSKKDIHIPSYSCSSASGMNTLRAELENKISRPNAKMKAKNIKDKIVADTTGISQSTLFPEKEKTNFKRKHNNLEPDDDKPLAVEIFREDANDPNVDQLKSLIKQQEGRDLKFVNNHNVYIQNPYICQHDIVSMWNTPHRIRSFIVVGVIPGNPNLLNGCEDEFDPEFFCQDRLFHNSVFTFVPTYSYATVQHKSKTFVIIEIESSWRKGLPSVVKSGVKLDNSSLKQNELWYRDGHTNVSCEVSDFAFGMIYQWFLGTTDLYSENVSPGEQGFGGQDLRPQTCTKSITVRTITNEVNILTGDLLSNLQDKSEIEDGEFTKFWKASGEFKKSHFILISGDISNKHKHLKNLSLIPWIAVYDFDINSCTNGLLNAVQDECEQKRQLKTGTWKEAAPTLSENGTHWCFMRGRREFSDTRTDVRSSAESDKHCVENHISWMQTVKHCIKDNCDQLVSFADEYTVYTIVMLWPKTEELILFIRKFLDSIICELTTIPNLIVCLHEKPKSKIGQITLDALRIDFSDSIHICILDFSDLCKGIGSRLENVGNNCMEYELPKMNSDVLSDFISEKDAMWLKEDLEVLYLKSNYAGSSDDQESIELETTNFFKGGRLPWSAWYEVGDPGVDIRRDSLKEAQSKIDKHVSQHKCTIFTILHAPGSGGSTLAQRILWDYHLKIPCVQVRRGTFLRSKDLSRKIDFIHDKTHLSTLILIDDEDDAKVKQFCRSLNFAIILNVKRYPFKMKDLSKENTSKSAPQKGQDNKIYLSGRVSANEAKQLTVKFGERCDLNRKRRLEKMKTDVLKSQPHSLYEFGMTVYSHEFKGIASYVKGYLQLEKDTELSPENKCLGYLALVYFYGQASLPCQFFARLFYKPSNHLMDLEEDFPHPLSEFIVYDTNERKQHMIRICHYEIAKEILEQILSKGVSNKNKKQARRTAERLSEMACKNLAQFAKGFIEYCSNKKTNNNTTSPAISHVLTKTFIYRDEIDLSHLEKEIQRKKPRLSQLLQDIPSGKPMFLERLQILEKLSSSFPDDPNFHAHVGRFYAFCGPDDDKKAEQKFKKAISLVEKRVKGKSSNMLDDSSKSTLVHVYHMYGTFKKKQISSLRGKYQNSATSQAENTELFNNNVSNLVEAAELACELFEKSREMTPDNCEIFTGSYIGEIDVRLQIADHIVRYFKPISPENEVLKSFLESDASDMCKLFIEETIYRLDCLINECCMDADMDSGERLSIMKMAKWYTALFKCQVLPEESLSVDDEINRRRIQIAALKVEFGSNGIENVKDEGTLEKIVTLYEDNFRDITMGLAPNVNKKDLDYDYREWMCAIRHELFQKTYTLNHVCTYVQKWNQVVRSPMSLFYLFVVKSALGIGCDEIQGNTELLIEAKELKQELAKKVVLKPKYPREWLGNGLGIKAIQQADRKVGMLQHDVKDQQRGPCLNLRVCKGTICSPNTKQYFGQIELDLQVENLIVHFVPKKAELDGPRHIGRRVQFNLAFSFEHGYEACNVQILTRHGCSKCSKKLEFKMSDTCLVCPNCNESVYKDDLNVVFTDSEDEEQN